MHKLSVSHRHFLLSMMPMTNLFQNESSKYALNHSPLERTKCFNFRISREFNSKPFADCYMKIMQTLFVCLVHSIITHFTLMVIKDN